MAENKYFNALQFVLIVLAGILGSFAYVIDSNTQQWNTIGHLQNKSFQKLTISYFPLIAIIAMFLVIAISYTLQKVSNLRRFKNILLIFSGVTGSCLIIVGVMQTLSAGYLTGVGEFQCKLQDDASVNASQEYLMVNLVNQYMCSATCPCPQSAVQVYDPSYLYDYAQNFSLDGKQKQIQFQTQQNGPVYDTFLQCWNKVLKKDGSWSSGNRSKAVDEYLGLMNHLEDQFECSGVCKYGLFWFTKSVSEPYPTKSCAKPASQRIGSILNVIAFIFIISGVFLPSVIFYNRRFWQDQINIVQGVELQNQDQKIFQVKQRARRLEIVEDLDNLPEEEVYNDQEAIEFDNSNGQIIGDQQAVKAKKIKKGLFDTIFNEEGAANDTEEDLKPNLDEEFPVEIPDTPLPQDEDGFPLDAVGGQLSWSRLMYKTNRTHPHEKKINSKGKPVFSKHPLLKTKTGCLSFRFQDRRSDLKDYGPGVVIFFQLMKNLCCIFTIIFLLSIPSAIIFYNADPPTKFGLTRMIKATSIGNQGSSTNACGIDSLLSQGTNVTVNLTCSNPEDVLSRVNQLGIRKYNSSYPQCDTLELPQYGLYHYDFQDTKCTYQSLEGQYTSVIDQQFNNDCYHKNSCQFSFNPLLLQAKEGCDLNITSESEAIVTAWCGKKEVNLFSYTINSETAAYIVIILDFLISFSLWISMMCFKPLVKLVEEEIEDDLINAEDFSVQITCDEDRYLTIDEKRATYWNWAHQLLNNDETVIESPLVGQEDKYQNEIASVEIGMSNLDYLPLLKKIDTNIQAYQNIKSYVDSLLACDPRVQNQKEIKEYRGKMESILDQIERDKLDAYYISDKRRAVQTTRKKEKGKEPDVYPVYAYIQFRSMSGKEKFLQNFRMSDWEKSSLGKFLGNSDEVKQMQKKFYRQQFPDLEEDAPAPNLILWENLGVKRNRSKTFLIYYFQGLILLWLLYLLSIYKKYKKLGLQNAWSKFKCEYDSLGVTQIPISDDEAIDYQLQENTFQVYCYCHQVVFKSGLGVLGIFQTVSQVRNSCWIWYLLEELKSQSLLVTAAGISYVADKLSSIAISLINRLGHKDLRVKMAAITNVVWIIQTVTTNIALLLLNTNWSHLQLPGYGEDIKLYIQDIAKGTYTDFTFRWVMLIGVSIALSNIINSIKEILVIQIYWKSRCKRKQDRSWTADRRMTKQKTQTDYEKLYHGPVFAIESIYAQVISVSMGILFFGVAMPSLYIAGICLTCSMYWTNKILFLRYFSTPPKFGSVQPLNVLKLLNWGAWVHMLFGIYILGSPHTLKVQQTPYVEDSYGLVQIFGQVSAYTIGTSPTRYQNGPCQLYLRLFVVFTILFALEKKWEVFSKLQQLLCLKYYKIDREQAYSVDIYKDLDISALQGEFERAYELLVKYETLRDTYKKQMAQDQAENDNEQNQINQLDQYLNTSTEFYKPQQRNIKELAKEVDMIIPLLNKKMKTIEDIVKNQVLELNGKPLIPEGKQNSLGGNVVLHNKMRRAIIMEFLKRLIVEAKMKTHARIGNNHSYNVMDNRRLALSKKFNRRLEQIQLDAYVGGDIEKLATIKTGDNQINPDIRLAKKERSLWQTIINLKWFDSEGPETENHSQLIVGYPNLGAFLTKERESFPATCFKCGNYDWTLTKMVASKAQMKYAFLIAVLSIAFTFGTFIVFAVVPFLLPCMRGTDHYCKKCNQLLAQKK